MTFQPDYRNFEAAVRNRRPPRLPLYEHLVNAESMERVLGTRFASLCDGSPSDVAEYFRQYCRFFREMTYDVVSFEVCIGAALPGRHAISGGRGDIQSRADFDAFPWRDIPALYWAQATPRYDALVRALPAGMKAVGGPGNGVFELAENLVGLEYLPLMQVDDPELYADLFRAIGDTMETIWREFLPRYGAHYAACRFGDDLGFKSSLLTNPSTVREHILPSYRRVIRAVHDAGKPFLLHSCGCIFEVMEDLIAAGIDAKHSNEDAIAPFGQWIERYGDRIGLLGGFDMDFLCTQSAGAVFDAVRRLGAEYRRRARGYALGSGNSIPAYVPTENYLAMIRAAQAIREDEG